MSSACGRVQTCRRACTDAPVCLLMSRAGRQYRHARALLLWLASKLHAPPQMSLLNPYHHEGAHPRRFME